MKIPPATISTRFCATCGQSDRYGTLAYDVHFSDGQRCAGVAEEVTYALTPTPQLVHPHELKPGDRVLVECEVFDDPEDYPKSSHVHAQPTGLWHAGDQYVGTWKTSPQSQPDPWVQKLP